MCIRDSPWFRTAAMQPTAGPGSAPFPRRQHASSTGPAGRGSDGAQGAGTTRGALAAQLASAPAAL
eukprot:5254936-Lingulodinium_polyedra.AAC.1